MVIVYDEQPAPDTPLASYDAVAVVAEVSETLLKVKPEQPVTAMLEFEPFAANPTAPVMLTVPLEPAPTEVWPAACPEGWNVIVAFAKEEVEVAPACAATNGNAPATSKAPVTRTFAPTRGIFLKIFIFILIVGGYRLTTNVLLLLPTNNPVENAT